ncbi:hypothetical protein [Bacillus sp. FSL K6-3431]|uniref:hypothetical protein n=1 Tax=Bacillus sp. FSL K6-3431 TaxID=2921500 RepID=UPI0030FC0F9F
MNSNNYWNEGLLLEKLADQWRMAGYKVDSNPLLVFVLKEGKRAVFFKDGRALIHGSSNPVEARKIYNTLLG